MDLSSSLPYEILNNQNFQISLTNFIKQYGLIGIEQAMQLYSNLQDKYICKTKSSISKLNIYDIYYLKIKEHNISIYTCHGIYHKYGTLNNELKFLSPYGFIKCNQSCVISLDKVRTIHQNNIVLINKTEIHMSRSCAVKVILAYSQYHPLSKNKIR